MTEQFPDFKQPPWVQSPSEVMDWIDATHPSKKTKGKKHGSSGEKVLRNLHVRFDLNVEQKKAPPSNIFSKFITMITGNGFVEEGFDLVSTAELVLRGLAKAKFKILLKIVIDEKTVFHHSDDHSDLRKTIDDFSLIIHDIQKEKSVEITATTKEGTRSIVIVKIMKIHKKKDHAVDLQIKGRIKEELYHAFKNYLTEKLDLKGLDIKQK
jgi:phosphotransferase system HPr-like phosphotransfer protein